MITDEKRVITTDDKILTREVVTEKTTDGKESLKITVKSPMLGGKASKSALDQESTQLGLKDTLLRFVASDLSWQPGQTGHKHGD